jgi:hypothetical protein
MAATQAQVRVGKVPFNSWAKHQLLAPFGLFPFALLLELT